MARLARVVAVGVAHHITQRGVDRQAVFTTDKCRSVYLALLKEHATRSHLRILGYCLMTNHVHVLAVPDRAEALAATFRYAHGRFAQYANARQCRSGHFWQNRFYSCPVEESAIGTVLAYVELNPVRAGLVAAADTFEWSSAGVHMGKRRDSSGVLDMNWWGSQWTQAEWSAVLASAESEPGPIRRATYTGRPLGSADFVADLERRLDRKLERQKAGGPKRHPNPAPGEEFTFQAAQSW